MKQSKRYAQAVWIESRNRWQINVQIDGQRKTFTSSTPGRKGKAEAERKADNWTPSAHQAAHKGAVSPTTRFNELCEMYLANIQPTVAPTTFARRKSMIKVHLLPKLEHLKLSSLTEQHWQDCMNEAAANGMARTSMNTMRGVIQSLRKYSKRNGFKLPSLEDIDIPHTPANTHPRTTLQPNELQVLFTDTTTKYHGVVIPLAYDIYAWRFCVLTGLRRSELCGLRNEDIYDGLVHVERAVNQFGTFDRLKTDNSRRVFALNRHMRQVLADQAEMLKSKGIISPWVFPNKDGNVMYPPAMFSRWKVYCAYHDFGISTLHELRHTLISIGENGNLEEARVKRMVGHTKNMTTYGTYAHAFDTDRQQLADDFDALFDKYLRQT